MEVAGSAATILPLVSFTGEVLVAGYGYLSRVHTGDLGYWKMTQDLALSATYLVENKEM